MPNDKLIVLQLHFLPKLIKNRSFYTDQTLNAEKYGY